MTADEIRTMVMKKRTIQGLKIKIVLGTPEGEEGEETTLYPKDLATKRSWVAEAIRKGYTIVEQ